tara:strand:+ start:1765 stop:2370 length:606 start_codon:yes stop_codon:yes gene_type:complete
MNNIHISIVFIVLIIFSLGCGSDPIKPEIDPKSRMGILKIDMSDFKFNPDRIDLESGMKVRIVLSNNSTTNNHSLSIGYGLIKQGGASTGFKNDLFDNVEVIVTGPAKLIRPGNALIIRDAEGDLDGTSGSFMIVKSPGTQPTEIEFIVPEKLGEYELGSFENGGKDYEDGMKGLIKIFPRTDKRETWNRMPSPTPIPKKN